jgi:hypothetical protein
MLMKNLEESCRGLIVVLLRYFSVRIEKNYVTDRACVRIGGVLVDIRTEYLSITGLMLSLDSPVWCEVC